MADAQRWNPYAARWETDPTRGDAPTPEVTAPQRPSDQRSAKVLQLPGRPGQRQYAAAQIGSLTSSWTTQDRHVNQSLQIGLRMLRARSRDLERNNDYAKHFLRLVTDNVAGPAGIMVQVHALAQDGTIDQADSTYLENTYTDFSKASNIDISGRLSRAAIERLVIRTIARDGEVLIRRWKGRGKYGYQLQLLDPALLDENHNEDLNNGRRVRMGIELDEFDTPLAYYLCRRPANDPRQMLGTTWGGDAIRVPATDIWHLFIPESIGQYRGTPWMATTMIRQKRLGAYQDAALAAAEEGAKKLAWVKTPDGDMTPLADGEVKGDGVTSGTLYTDSADVNYGMLPPGYGIESWDPKYPEQNYTPFVTDHVRAIASGLGVQYHKLGNNLEGVNFSSARAGEINERDVWLGLQNWMIETFCSPMYSEWLPLAILSGRLNLPASKLFKFDSAVFQGRRWDWVDPEKDVDASLKAISGRLTSRARVIRKMGFDPEEIWAECEAEEKRFGPVDPTTKAPPAGAPNGQ